MGIQFRTALVVFGIAVVVAVPAAARTYKWVDEDGTTHYSQSKPPNRQAVEMSKKISWTSGIGKGDDCNTVMCRAARLDSAREKRERAAQEQRDKAARAAAAVPVFPTHIEETDDEKIARLVSQCKNGRGSKCDSHEEKRRMLLQDVDLTHAERRALRNLSPANQRRALLRRIPKEYRTPK